MTRISTPAEAWVLVCDGSKAVFYRNVSSIRHVRLIARHTLEEHHPPTRDLGSDRPGRSYDSHDSSRSAVASPDSTGFSIAASALPLCSAKRAILCDSRSKSGSGGLDAAGAGDSSRGAPKRHASAAAERPDDRPQLRHAAPLRGRRRAPGAAPQAPRHVIGRRRLRRL